MTVNEDELYKCLVSLSDQIYSLSNTGYEIREIKGRLYHEAGESMQAIAGEMSHLEKKYEEIIDDLFRYAKVFEHILRCYRSTEKQVTGIFDEDFLPDHSPIDLISISYISELLEKIIIMLR